MSAKRWNPLYPVPFRWICKSTYKVHSVTPDRRALARNIKMSSDCQTSRFSKEFYITFHILHYMVAENDWDHTILQVLLRSTSLDKCRSPLQNFHFNRAKQLVMLDTNFIQFYFDKNVAKSFLKMWGKWRYHGMGEAGRRCQEMAPKPFYARVDIHISPHGCTHTQRKLKWKTRNALWGGNLKLNIRFYSSSCVWGSVV